MVRRRTAAPKASAPVRSSRATPPPSQHAPMPQQQAPMGSAPRQGPGLFGQMAATAGGVAIGSAVGHSVGHMLTGGGGSNQEQAQPAQQYQQGQQQYQTPCEFEWKQFLQCTENTSDLAHCQAYNDLFKDCKSRNNL